MEVYKMTVKIYTLDEVSEILKITKRTIYTYVKEGSLKASRIGRYWRVSEEQLQEFLNTGTPVLDGNRAKTKNKSK
tara:strand:- start:477 stop:704 length:228 start_codon:yes stop_codon:yes gene_type:complete